MIFRVGKKKNQLRQKKTVGEGSERGKEGGGQEKKGGGVSQKKVKTVGGGKKGTKPGGGSRQNHPPLPAYSGGGGGRVTGYKVRKGPSQVYLTKKKKSDSAQENLGGVCTAERGVGPGKGQGTVVTPGE